ncbi:MAG: hypothetical protein AAFN30_08550 [Actinomycetota bacterium]
MSTLAHVLEEEGLATISLGIIEGQLRSTAPPRGLFVDFPLGRPLGRPLDVEFQRRVLDHAFSLLDATGPVIETFDEPVQDDGAVMACSLPPIDDPDAHPAVAEARGLRAAYDRTEARTEGRVGAHRVVMPDDVPAAIEAFVRVAEGTPWKEAGIPGIPARVAQDIRGYYEAAAMALADHTPGAFEATRWFLTETEAAKAILAAREQMKADGVKQPIWQFLVTEQF